MLDTVRDPQQTHPPTDASMLEDGAPVEENFEA